MSFLRSLWHFIVGKFKEEPENSPDKPDTVIWP